MTIESTDLRPAGHRLLGTAGWQYAVTFSITAVDEDAVAIAAAAIAAADFRVFDASGTEITTQGPEVTPSVVGLARVVSVVFTAAQTTALTARATKAARWQLEANFDSGGVVPVVGGEISFAGPGVPGASTSTAVSVAASIGTATVTVAVTVGGTTSASGATTLDGLTDVTVTTPVVGHVLRHDGMGWVNVLGASHFQPLATVLTNTTASFTTAQETKLSGIEASATADQTAAEILAALLTVDGAGSGLDADLLDGQSAAAFEVAGAVTAHTGAVDPHGDRSYTDAQIAAFLSTAFDFKAPGVRPRRRIVLEVWAVVGRWSRSMDAPAVTGALGALGGARCLGELGGNGRLRTALAA